MLTQLTVRDFRNLATLDLDVPARGLAIVGDNGHGKTNLLEAVAYLRLLRSWRGARDADLIRFGAPAFHVRATLAPPARAATVAVGFARSGKRKLVELDGVEQTRLSHALGALPSVGVSPADTTLVSGGPGERRRFLDVTLALTDPTYLAALQQYRGALARRNAVLRDAQRAGAARNDARRIAQVAVWEPALAQHGATLIAARRAWVASHAESFAATCAAIGEARPVALAYDGAGRTGEEAATESEGALAAAYEQQRPQELRRGTTLVGPHRDDLKLTLEGRDLRTFGSAGQQRTAAFALRLAEAETVRRTLGAPPLLLLDDPFAELDTGRATAILGLLEAAGLGQVLLAVPRAEDIPEAFTRLERRTMRAGVLS